MKTLFLRLGRGAREAVRLRRLLSTLFVLLGMVVLVRLGFWQLDRLAQRRARNAFLQAQLQAPPLDLLRDPLPADPTTLALRKGVARGRYDVDYQVLLEGQLWQGQAGRHVITPLVLADGRAVLVDRGWVPYADPPDPAAWPPPTGQVEVLGWIRPSETLSARPTAASVLWYRVDIPALQSQLPYPLLPVYLQPLAPETPPSTPPYLSDPEIDLSEGPHKGYAVQWFLFAVMFGLGYLYYLSERAAAVADEGGAAAG